MNFVDSFKFHSNISIH